MLPEERRRAARSARLKAQYNITADEWDLILAYQKGVCPVCKRDKDAKGQPLKWNTDHDHKSGLTRGILCTYCNRKLNEFFTLEIVANLLAYLKKPTATATLGEARYGRKGRITNKRPRRKKRRTTKKK